MRRSLAIAVVASLLLHVLPLVTFLLWHEPARIVTDQPIEPAPTEQGAVELMMVEQEGAGEPQAAPQEPSQDPPREETTPAPPAAPPPAPIIADSLPLPPPPPPPELSEIPEPPPPPPAPPEPERPDAAPPEQPDPVPRPKQERPESTAVTANTTPAREAAAPEFNLGGTDSPSNAIVLGDNVIPASPDNQSRNRPPIYPIEATRRGQQGTVTLLIHVSPLGVSMGADVLQSSGYPMLDRAALDAITTWRFRPAVRNGTPVSFDMPMRFTFALE